MRSWQCVVIGFVLIVPTLCRPQNYYRNVDNEDDRTAYIRQLEAAVEGAARAGDTSQALLLEDRLEDSILQQAREGVAQDGGDPVRAARDLEALQQEWRRDKRAVDFLSGLLGSSSGGGGGGSAAGGSDSGSILNLVTPLLGSSSGGGSGGGGGDGQSAGGSDSGSILNLVGPLLGSSSGGGGGGGGSRAEEGSGEGEAGDGSAGGGSDSGSILSLVGPLLGSSSGGGGNAEGGAGGEGGDAGSGSGSILSLLGPLLGSSSGGGGGDGSGGGGSDLSSILGVSNSSGGDGSGGGGGGVGGIVNAVKVGFLQDKVQLLLRVKFGIFTKILNTLSGAIAAASSPQHVPINELKYPDP